MARIGCRHRWNSNHGNVRREARGGSEPEHVPQAFTHWTHHHSNGTRMVCDLQGVYVPSRLSYMLVDPVIHSDEDPESGRNYGRTDRGERGFADFL